MNLPLVAGLSAKGLNAGARFALLVIVERTSGFQALGLLSLLFALSTAITFVANAESYRLYLLSVRGHMLGFLSNRAFLLALFRCFVLAVIVAFATVSQHQLPLVLIFFCLTEALLQDSARSILFNGWAPAFDLVHSAPIGAAIVAALVWAGPDPVALATAVLVGKSLANLVAVALCRLIPSRSVSTGPDRRAVFPPLDIIILSVLTALYPAVERMSVQAVFGLEGLGRYAIVFAASGLAVMLFQAALLQPQMARVARGEEPTGKMWHWGLAGLLLAILCLAFRNPLQPVAPQPDEVLALLLLVVGHLGVSFATLRSLRPSFRLARPALALMLVTLALLCAAAGLLVSDLVSPLVGPAFAYLLFSLCLLQASRTTGASAPLPQ